MPFHSFVVLAGMRTGSNFLDSNLAALDGVMCHGEAFNPSFLGHPNTPQLLGMTQEERDADPLALLARIRAAPGLNGFRYFSDHDPRVLPALLEDPGVAKVILTRNPLETYVSRGIAVATGQWRLTDARRAKTARVRFDAEAFEAHVDETARFHHHVQRALQCSGQSGFALDYEDLNSLEVLNGLAAWLGVPARLERLQTRFKRQGILPLCERVENPGQMQEALAGLDAWGLEAGAAPDFGAPRPPGAAIPRYIAAPAAPLLFQPIASGPEAVVGEWLSALDGGAAPRSGFRWRSLRDWQRAHPQHRRFTVLRHPVLRAYACFRRHMVAQGPECFAAIRAWVWRRYGMRVSAQPGWPAEEERAAFLAFLAFLSDNLAGRTPHRIDRAWMPQVDILRGFGAALPPDMILREETLEAELGVIAALVDCDPPPLALAEDPLIARLDALYGPDVEAAVRRAFARDYDLLGFSDWRGGAPT
ncbi:sulfotransferase family 2 domain-containing protein [Pseudoroseicyclus aestuarii]|uniref:Sulfotransferase family protein n=1 Tax=Pseudoroseicyclus aestuarii TaxID=1795041 RepID=A0A318SRU6_9RHOB|nr:sulfotransferase family 2 domain-containing protein [Pseudoroseicyclus aestuarii]PYE84413.1 sulfotransferase family protein [Pseudoroseicyclus aestuarii]